ncbi:MAG: dihydrofolate reductase family protein [Clostridiales bacterium]|jgi:dihydrofolate reductase|nr:dihydrofolate reductase family protein [Clostridiales bacterium]
MGKIVLCIAASLDGYIADEKGGVGFLFEKARTEPDDDYARFYAGVECMLFGSATWRQMVEEISPGKWGFADKKCYVFSSRLEGATADVQFTGMSPEAFAVEVAAKAAGTVWLFGGRRLIDSFMRADLIDEYWLYTMPVLLGGGVPLFTPRGAKMPLCLARLGQTDGMAKALYTRERE